MYKRQGLTIENRLARGEAVPAEVLAAIKGCDVLLKGPTATPKGGTLESANVTLRRALDLYANVRPVRIPEEGVEMCIRDSLAGIDDEAPDPVRPALPLYEEGAFPVLNAGAGERMREAILAARREGDSVGGVVRVIATGLPAGLGEPMFGGVENHLAAALFLSLIHI